MSPHSTDRFWTGRQTMTSVRPAAVLDLGRAEPSLDGMAVSFQRGPRVEGAAVPSWDGSEIGRLRHEVGWQLRASGVPVDLIEDVQLLVSEMVTNAFRYGAGEDIDLRLTWSVCEVRLVAGDGSTERPRLRDPDLESESGRGLFLIDALTKERSGSWGVSDDNTTTWCSLPMPVCVLPSPPFP